MMGFAGCKSPSGRAGPARRGRSAAVALALAASLLLLFAPTAAAKKVYDYVYSGSYIDGAGSEKGAFPSTLASVGYDTQSEAVVALVGGQPVGYFSKFTKAGVPSPFSAPGLSDTITIPAILDPDEADIAIDNTGGPNSGNIYIVDYRQYGYGPDGTTLPGFGQFNEGACGIAVAPQGNVWVGAAHGTGAGSEIAEFTATGERTGSLIKTGENSPLAKQVTAGEPFRPCHLSIDSEGNFYLVRQWGFFSAKSQAMKLDSNGNYLYDLGSLGGHTSRRSTAVDPTTDNVFVHEGSLISEYDPAGVKLDSFGAPDAEHSFEGLTGVGVGGMAVDPVNHDVWVVNGRNYPGGVRHIERFVRTPPTTTVPTTTTEGPPELLGSDGASAVLHGIVNADGIATTGCRFEWGPTQALGSSAPCEEGDVFAGSEDNAVSAHLGGLSKGTVYYFRINSENSNGRGSPGVTMKFIAQDTPVSEGIGVTDVNTDGIRLTGEVDPNGGNTTYHFEWGLDEGYGHLTPETPLTERVGSQGVDDVLTGLSPDTTYHFRIVIHNEVATTVSGDRVFKTYPRNPGFDPCSNSQVRKQTEASLLLDCRAYELVSAGDAGGYDVESDIVPGQSPFGAYPRAKDRVLYGLHFGSVPGVAGAPTNYGLDPYLASRTSSGWTTSYVGLPADGMPSKVAFGSPLLAADPALGWFAFGGKGICEPCFDDGSINIPLRSVAGSVTKGMAGSRSPAADPVGYVAKRFSGDGTHFVFAANLRFETAGKNGEVTIYDRNLVTGVTQVVSTLPSGQTIGAGEEVGELDISADGSRVVIGQRSGTDAADNAYWHPYMHIGTETKSVDLAPTATGVLFAGMTADGSKAFFTTADSLLEADEDTSADLYEADVSAAGALTLQLLSDGAPAPAGNLDACSPAANADGNNWNAVGAASADGCGVVAIAGGGGVAKGDGTVYFLSPEKLDGTGVADQPNLFVVRPGSNPQRVATLEPSNPLVRDAVADSEIYRYGDFQVSPGSGFAAFDSSLSLTGYENRDHTEVYRYDPGSQDLVCVSCPGAGTSPSRDATLSPHGLSLLDDGRVFFTSEEPYVLRDTNEKKDAYEWSGGVIQLISTGQSPDNSTLLSASSDGADVFFFTRQTLAHEDQNGSAVKIYDAREGGGFLYQAPPLPCAASDECHGRGTEPPPPPQIKTVTGSGQHSNPAGAKAKCRKHHVRRGGKCVKKKRRPRHGASAHKAKSAGRGQR